MKPVRILGTGSFVPPKVLSNFDLQEMGLDTTDEWVIQRTGVRERRIADPEVTTSDLAYEASLKAFDMAGIKAKDLDLILVATITPDTCCPSAANWLQAKLDAPQAVTFDISAACSGFIFALNVAEQYLRTGAAKLILVVASEIMTRTLDWTDRTSCILVGGWRRRRHIGLGSERSGDFVHPSTYGWCQRPGSVDAWRWVQDHAHIS